MRPIVRSSLALPLLLLAVCVPAAWILLSPAAAAALAALALLEIAMAADTSVPMAGIAARIQHPARRLFLSVGLVLGVLAMRLLLPPTAVAVTQAESPADAAAEAILQPGLFAAHLDAARPGIAAFGAVFIWLVFSEYLFNVERTSRRPWLGRFEAALAEVRFPRLAALGVGAAAATVAIVLADSAGRGAIAIGSVTGIIAYLANKLVAAWATRDGARGWKLHLHAATVVFERGLTVFMLFEILDGSSTLSAASSSPGLSYLEEAAVAIVGVAIGAVFLARLTATVNAQSGLKRLRYLKAGAAYVLGVLSVLLWASLAVPIPGGLAGWFGSIIIGTALLTSLPRRRSLRNGNRSNQDPTAPAS